MAERDDGHAGEATPITTADVSRLAARYLARYAASSHRLRAVLNRQVRRWHERRGLPRPEPTATAALIDAELARLAGLAVLDDDAVTLARARRLVGKGLSGDAIRRRLAAEHLDARLADLDAVIVEDDVAQARRFAQRKRLGPFRGGPREPFRDRDIRSLVRAGFSVRDAVAAIDGEADEKSAENA